MEYISHRKIHLSSARARLKSSCDIVDYNNIHVVIAVFHGKGANQPLRCLLREIFNLTTPGWFRIKREMCIVIEFLNFVVQWATQIIMKRSVCNCI